MHAVLVLASALSPSDASAPLYGVRETMEVVDTTNDTLRLRDVVRWAKAGNTDEAIIAAAHGTGTVYSLRADQIVWLKQNGVHDCVIKALLEPPVVYVRDPPAPAHNSVRARQP